MPRSPGTFARITQSAQLFPSAANPQYLYGQTIQTKGIALGSLSAEVAIAITTSSLAVTCNWQGSDDGTTFRDFVPQNGAANVALATGTGTIVTTYAAIDAPNVTSYKYARLRARNSGANADAATDGVTFSYRYSKV